MKASGSCYCGDIEFEAEVEPENTSICHCMDCQRLSGTAYRVSVSAPANRFRVIRGRPKEFIKIAASGSRRIQAFCERCGTALYATAESGCKPYNIRAGTLRERAQLVPVREIWCDSVLPWVPRIAGIESWKQEKT